jgi:hypothetical protein
MLQTFSTKLRFAAEPQEPLAMTGNSMLLPNYSAQEPPLVPAKQISIYEQSLNI